MDMDFAKMMQMMNSMNGSGNKDMLMQLLPTMMNNSGGNKPAQATQITLNSDEVNKSIFKLYQDEN